jgi:glycine betaine/proline transport system permease protein
MAVEEYIETSGEKRTLWQWITTGRGGKGMPVVVKVLIGLVALAVLMVIIVALYNTVPAGGEPGAAINFPDEWSFGWEIMKFIDRIVDWIVVTWDPFFSAINVIVVRYILGPLEDFFLWIPWWSIILITGFLAWRTVGVKFAAITVLFLGLMCVFGLIDLGSMTLAITLTSALICVIFGLPVGIIAAKSERFDNVLKPILDMMQTMPSFVYLIPALMLFGLGKTPAVMATCIYAIPPIIRLTNLGIRQVDASVVEASRSFGSTAWQLLTKVQIPLALPTILAGLNQTIMMALAMVVIASMIGAMGLGTEILRGINRIEVGRGLIAGVSIVFMAIILDRISQGFANRPEARSTA